MVIIANVLAGLLLAALVWRAVVAHAPTEGEHDEGAEAPRHLLELGSDRVQLGTLGRIGLEQVDRLQIGFSAIHKNIRKTWFA